MSPALKGWDDLRMWRRRFKELGPIEGLHIFAFTRRLLSGLVMAPCGVGALLRGLVHSPIGRWGVVGSKSGDPYPLPLEPQVVAAMRVLIGQQIDSAETASVLGVAGVVVPSLVAGCKQWRQYRQSEKKHLVTAAWLGLLVVGLNTSLGFTTRVAVTNCPLKKAVLGSLWTDACDFVEGDGLSKEVLRWPEVSWSSRMGQLSVSYVGEVVEKARWLSWKQVEPGLPPSGKGGCLEAADFCDPEVRAHLLDAELSRLPDDQVPHELPHAVVRATQQEWNVIAAEMVQRGVACVIEEDDIATFRGEKVLNGAFGVVKPNRWVDHGGQQLPVLRLIMDFRAANCLHRMLPGAVDSLVGAAKWIGFTLGPGEVLVSSGDDLVACFYLFRVPFSWSRYFAFRKPVPRCALGLEEGDGRPVFIASQVLPMGWAAAVTVVQHIHRNIALKTEVLPAARELHRQRSSPQKETLELSSFWNLYIDDLTIMEIISEAGLVEARSSGDRSKLQEAMEKAYEDLKVPYSKEKASTREEVFEKLGAFVDGRKGVLGVTSKRHLEMLSLILFMMQQDKVPTKWVQILLGKYVHIVKFRRPLFSCIKKSWRRLHSFHAGGPLDSGEVDEWAIIAFLLPLTRTSLRARVSGMVTCSDASEYGGGICRTVGMSSLGKVALSMEDPVLHSGNPELLVFEWFAGIGGLSRSLERLKVRPCLVVVCECDPHCIAVLRKFIPGCIVWKDIQKVSRQEVREVFDRCPSIKGVVQGGGSPCQGLSQLSSGRKHFEDDRSVLFYDLVEVMRMVEQEALARRIWHFGFVENAVCDEADQITFREVTGWWQWLICSGTLSRVRRPRFFWTSSYLDFGPICLVEPGNNYQVVHIYAPLEPESCWESPGWSWLGSPSTPFPTFTRSIPRSRPPRDPAGLHHTPADARERWWHDDYRYPPYTYKLEHCVTNGIYARVLGAGEREALMGFFPGHTVVKEKAGIVSNQDVRCSCVGNSFHTGVVSCLVRQALLGKWLDLKLPTPTEMAKAFHSELGRSQKECFVWRGNEPDWEDTEDWLDRLEQQSFAVSAPLPGGMSTEVMLILNIFRNVSYRGSDVHVDTLSFYRPERMPKASIDSRQWHWKISKGWPWLRAAHINVLEMEALLQTIRYRAKSLRVIHKKFLHLVDSLVVLGVAAKGRTTSRMLAPSLHRCNMLILALHCYPILAWVQSHLNPSDEPSRWYVPPS